jgi:hypothetical protein
VATRETIRRSSEAHQARKKAEREHFRQKREADRESVRRHKARVISIEQDGKYVDVQFTLNGERVSATYKLIGWGQAPAEIVADTMRRLANGPQTVLYPKGWGGKQEQQPSAETTSTPEPL